MGLFSASVAVFLLSVTAVASVNDQRVTYFDPRDTGDCESFSSSLPNDIEIKKIRVPLDWDDLGANKFGEVFVYGRWTGIEKTVPPVIFFNGGPNYSSWSLWNLLKDKVKDKHFRFIFFDQRGTGCSNFLPLLSNKDGYKKLRAFRGESIVRDAEFIRNELFPGEKINVFGHSFGSKLVLRYTAMFPQSLVKTVYSGDTFEIVDPQKALESSKRYLLRKYDIFLDFLEKFPQNRKRLESLKALISDQVCVSDKSGLVKICGYEIFRESAHFLEESNFEYYDGVFSKILSDGETVNWEEFDGFVDRLVIPLMNPVLDILASYEYQRIYNGVRTSHWAYLELKKKGHFSNQLTLLRPANNKWVIKVDNLLGGPDDFVKIEQAEKGLSRNLNLKIVSYSGTKDGLRGPGGGICQQSENRDRLFCSRLQDKYYKGGHNDFIDAQGFWSEFR